MATPAARPPSSVLGALGDFRWVRAHVSLFAVGAVIIVCINLLLGSDSLWSLTAIGIWAMLLVVHMVILAIARLSGELLAEDDEEIVLLPVKDAVFIEPKADPPASWNQPPPPQPQESSGDSSEPVNQETVSWQIATNAAQAKRESSGE